MSVQRIAVISQEFVPVPVTFIHGCGFDDPSVFPVEMAFKLPGVEPAPADWHAAAWDTSCAPSQYWAQILVGAPAGVVLAVGTYVPWVRVTGSPEIPVKPATGFVIIY